MIIRRSFRFCAAHVVRNCTSRRCSSSLHGHNYLVEIFVSADSLDNAGMILDFGIFKNEIADFIDGFDHGHHIWDRESQDMQKFVQENFARYVFLDRNPSAENYALIFLFFITKFIEATSFGNNEGKICVESVRVHETDHGYAEAFKSDLDNPRFCEGLSLDSVTFSQAILEEWKDKQMMQKLRLYFDAISKSAESTKPFVYLRPLQQI